MACKEVMVSAPLVVLLYDRTFVSATWHDVWKRHGALHLSLAATWTLLALLVLSSGSRGGTAGFSTDISVASYVATQFAAVPRYLLLAVWPHPLVFDYGASVVTDPAIVLPCAIFILGLMAATIVALWRWPALGFLGVVFFAVLAPSSSVVPIATQTVAEHRMYLPLAVLVLLVVLAAFRWLGRGAYFALGGAAALLALLTILRNSEYRSNESLWRDTVAKRPENPRAHCSLADALVVADRADDALPSYKEALRLKPDYAEAQLNLGTALISLGRAPEAIAPLDAALRLKPAAAQIHHALANALAHAGRAPEAFTHYAEATRLRPDDVTNLCDWGNALQRAGRIPDAIARYETAVRIAPNFAMGHNNLANALAESGRLPDALAHYETALRLEPSYAEGHNNFAVALARSARFPEAIQHFETALRLRPDYPSAHENLGKVYLALGDNDAAEREFALARRGAPARSP
jgi:tetratricopeptide (TPR) repeat protein